MSIRPQPTPDTRLPAWSLAAVAGVVAAGVALGAGELVAGLLPGAPSPLAAVGSALIDLAPAGSKEVVVGLFGTNDKLALTILVATAVLALGAGVGLLARRSPVAAGGGIVAVVGVGVLAALRVPATGVLQVLLLGGLQAVAAIRALVMLLAAADPRQAAAHDLAGDPARDSATSDATDASDATRRGFLLRAGILGAFAIIGGGFGRTLLDRPGRRSNLGHRRSHGRGRHPLPCPARADAPAGRLVRHRRPHAPRRPQRGLLPHRHRAHHARDRHRHVAAARSRHGRAGGDAVLRPARGVAAGRAVRDDRLRQQ